MKHGQVYTKKITVENGNQEFAKRVKFCAVHGEIDLFLCGGEIPWQRVHGRCGKNAPARPQINLRRAA